MLNQAICPECRKDGWTIKIDYKAKDGELTCMNCGHQEYIRQLFGMRNIKIKPKKKEVKYELGNISKTN